MANRRSKEKALIEFILDSPAVKAKTIELVKEHIRSVLMSRDKSEEAYLERKQNMRRGKRRQLNCERIGRFKEEYVYFQLFKFLRRIALEVKDPMPIEAEQLFSLGRYIDSPYIVDVLMFQATVFAIGQLNGISRKEAELMFRKDSL